MTASPVHRPRHLRLASSLLPLLGLLAACNGPLDYDLRGQIGAFNTTNAAQTATTNRPAPDDRGLITYPSYQVAVANRNDTVADVAMRIGLPVGEVAKFNGMSPSDKLRKGELLALPRRAPEQAKPDTTATSPGGVDIASLAGAAIESAPATSPNPGSVTTTQIQPKPKPAVVQQGPEPVRHKVVRGETAYTISRLYQVPVKALAEWNGLGSDFSIREGQYLLIPLKDQSAPTQLTSDVSDPGQGSTTPLPPSSAKPLPQEQVAPAAISPAAVTTAQVDVPKPSRTAEAAMAYPVQGKIIRTYSKGKNDGIDISAAPGTAVKAAEGGTIAAITKDSQNVPIVVVRHSSKLLTVYANVTDISVKKGEKVKRGQQIAALRTGDQAFLHFEVRNGFESLDPLPYLN